MDLNLALILDLVRFLQFEDKMKEDDGFEKRLWGELMNMLGSFEDSTKLAACFILKSFHNPSDFFEKVFSEFI